MQIQSIDNKSNVRFKSRNNVDKAAAFVNLDDNQLKELAYVMSYDKDSQKKHKKSLLSSFYAIPIVDTIASGILVSKSSFGRNLIEKLVDKRGFDGEQVARALNNASLKTRLKSAGSTAGFWALILGGIGIYDGVKKLAAKKSDSINHFQKDNPISSFVVDMGIILGGCALGAKGLKKLQEHFPSAKKEIAIKTNRVLGKLNRTKFNKDILPKLAEGTATLSSKAPWAVNAGRFALANSVWIMFGLSLLKTSNSQKHERQKVEHNFHKLKSAQLETAKQLNKIMEAETIAAARKAQKAEAQALKESVGEESNSEVLAEEF